MASACARRSPDKTANVRQKIRRSTRVPATPGALSRVRHFVSAIARESGFTDAGIYDIAMAVNEACANAIIHGTKRRDQYIEVSAFSSCKSFIVTLTGNGPFKKTGARRKLDSEDGRGLWLMSALMDHVTISVGDGCTRVVLIKHKTRSRRSRKLR
ncbi:MAG: ATP-binding protein [Actinobacteria bacterium]|nr:ATP-binding protein [Actinomycetota bacterium]